MQQIGDSGGHFKTFDSHEKPPTMMVVVDDDDGDDDDDGIACSEKEPTDEDRHSSPSFPPSIHGKHGRQPPPLS